LELDKWQVDNKEWQLTVDILGNPGSHKHNDLEGYSGMEIGVLKGKSDHNASKEEEQ
jgi:hypothetical protein